MRKPTPNQVKKLNRYLKAVRAKADAEMELAAAKDDAMAIVASRGGEMTHDEARLSIESTVKYTYSEKVSKRATELNADKAFERENGIAKAITGEKLVCRDAK